MEESNRINRRSRPRPYDLRRKVLLKNFLREQMTYMPQTRLTSNAKKSDANFTEESPNNLEVDEDLQDLNDENNSSSSASTANIQINSSSENIDENHLVNEPKIDDSVVNSSDNSTDKSTANVSSHEPKFLRFSSLMNLRSESKKRKGKGIIKAKQMCKTIKSPVKSRSFKVGIEKLFSGRRISNERSKDRATKNSSKSVLSLFKSRRKQRKNRVDKTNKSVCVGVESTSKPTKSSSTTSNQSVQTDDNWSKEELNKVHQSNRLLREENRLLSESLSYFMSSNSIETQNNHHNFPLQSSNQNINGKRRFSDCYDSQSFSSLYNYDSWNPRSRILRSKSVQEPSDRRNISRNNYRTRSMNCHNRNDFSREPVSSASGFNRYSDFSIPRARRKNILANLPVTSASRGVQRRSSMPERILSENDRARVCRWSGSFRDSSSRTPFHSLPSEAFY